jgi:hypothetical protein
MEESIWISIRMLEERRNLLLNMPGRDKSSVSAWQTITSAGRMNWQCM